MSVHVTPALDFPSEASSEELHPKMSAKTANSKTQVSSGSHSTVTTPKKQAPVLPTLKEEKV